MKSLTKFVMLGLLLIPFAVIVNVGNAFAAEEGKYTEVRMEAGSANAGDNKGYDPKDVTIAVGATVEWENKDSAGHTVTSGNPGDSDFGALFDSTKDPAGFLIKPEGSWKYTFDKAGEFPYFCQVHPWMLGKVTVSEAAATPPTTPPPSPPMEGTMLTGEKIDLTVNPSLPFDRTMSQKVMLTFTSKGDGGKAIQHTDWAITISMNGKEVFKENFHDHDGTLDLEVTPEQMSMFDVGKPSTDDPNKLVTSSFPVSGPLFMDNGKYEVNAQITGIEFKPLSTPITQNFSINVVPEFPVAAILPLVLAFAAIVAVMRIRSSKNPLGL
ncbi:MAG: hypothetical protein HZA83_02845 [Thaumarchaeota archaeon]|nr:hypothetical protein [Nitrososphaerota archaeon]